MIVPAAISPRKPAGTIQTGACVASRAGLEADGKSVVSCRQSALHTYNISRLAVSEQEAKNKAGYL